MADQRNHSKMQTKTVSGENQSYSMQATLANAHLLSDHTHLLSDHTHLNNIETNVFVEGEEDDESESIVVPCPVYQQQLDQEPELEQNKVTEFSGGLLGRGLAQELPVQWRSQRRGWPEVLPCH